VFRTLVNIRDYFPFPTFHFPLFVTFTAHAH
jgi:hypothetical protein